MTDIPHGDRGFRDLSKELKASPIFEKISSVLWSLIRVFIGRGNEEKSIRPATFWMVQKSVLGFLFLKMAVRKFLGSSVAMPRKELPVTSTYYSKFYYGLRLLLHKKRWLLRLTQIIRALLILGPFRNSLTLYYQKFGNNKPLQANQGSFFNNLDLDKILENINNSGYSLCTNLPQESVSEILEYCENKKLGRYYNPHTSCKTIHRISHDPIILEIARKYLGAEPILWLTQMRWSFPSSDQSQENMTPSDYQEPDQYDSHAFHYDALDFKSLTIFIYLTDVDIDSAPHVIIASTHNNKSISEIVNIIISDEVAHKRYGDRMQIILGKRGTVFFEETSSYHKVSICRNARLMLAIDYVLRRKEAPVLLHQKGL